MVAVFTSLDISELANLRSGTFWPGFGVDQPLRMACVVVPRIFLEFVFDRAAPVPGHGAFGIQLLPISQ
jgi:hypothetical protein